MTPQEAADLIYEQVCGTPQNIMLAIDYMIEDGEIDPVFFAINEMEIMGLVDNVMFTCATCGWTVGISDMSSNMTDNVCVDCYKEEENAR